MYLQVKAVFGMVKTYFFNESFVLVVVIRRTFI